MTVDVQFRDGIVYIVPPADVTQSVAQAIVEAEFRLIREQNGNKSTPVLVDNRGVKTISSEARQLFADTVGAPGVSKVAFLGGSVFIRTVSNSCFACPENPRA